ncbi:hypothetical protein K9N68_39660 (plasmid) [Kovacikia minuta CCNUW1]|uniref:hypothetical protein n=1 Tax=Kovacikia minuta TaxID=2931930 RepID=UPI001CCEA771|nr:hypothetical protein [Kovacikia minuta]UBF30773.1 hypothetical protein K9N68_39660 [Kovacikia minuta CCNUW1]
MPKPSPAKERQWKLEDEAISMFQDIIIANQQGEMPTPEQIKRGQEIMAELNRLKGKE